MGSKEEIQEAIDACNNIGNNKIILLKCCSEYPSPWEDMNLGIIPDMMKQFGLPVGLSDHSKGDLGAVVGVTLGACVVEKHLMLDGVDSVDSEFSMIADDFSQLVYNVRNAKIIANNRGYELTQGEKMSAKGRRSIFAVKDIKPGDFFSEDNIRVIRPSYGMRPKYYKSLLGTASKNEYKFGQPINETV